MVGSQPPWFTPRNMPEQIGRVDPAAPGDAVLAVGREDVVVVAQRPAGADLCGLLAQQRRPQSELALALKGGGLGVEAAGQDHVPVQPAQLVRGSGRSRTRGARRARPRASAAVRAGARHSAASSRRSRACWLRRGLRAAVLSTVTCVLLRRSGPRGPPGDQCGSPVSVPVHGVGATRPGSGVTGAPASALPKARYPVRRITAKPHLTCDFAWISK